MADLKTLKDVERWLKEPARTRDQIVIFAARAALRAVPALAAELESKLDPEKSRAAVILPVFRAMAAPWVAAKYPTQGAGRAATAAAYAATAAAYRRRRRRRHHRRRRRRRHRHRRRHRRLRRRRRHRRRHRRHRRRHRRLRRRRRPRRRRHHAATAATVRDANLLRNGMTPGEVARSPLWHGAAPKWARGLWSQLRAALVTAEEDWDVWTGWYERRLAGAPLGLPLEHAWLQLTDDDWRRGPAHANRRLRELIEGQEETGGDGEDEPDSILPSEVPPPEPATGPGPDYRPRSGKLSVVAHPPLSDEIEPQARLHERLKPEVRKLTSALRTCRNQYPELANAADEYQELVNAELAELDVTGLWSVGGSLAAFSQAYARQVTERTIAEPLEPQLDSALTSVVRNHGAFILGFEEGRDLIERADQFALEPAVIAEIEVPGNVILNELTDNAELVDADTRKLHELVRDVVTEYKWQFSRTGYSAYLIVRKAVHAMIKFTVGEGKGALEIAAILAGASVLLGDPNAEFIRAAVPVLREHGAQILAFFNHSPEFRAYVEWALNVLDADHQDRSET